MNCDETIARYSTRGYHTGTGTIPVLVHTPINQFFHLCGKFLNVYHIFFRTFFPSVYVLYPTIVPCVFSLDRGHAKFSEFFSPRNPILKSHEFFGRRHHSTVSMVGWYQYHTVNFNRFTKCTIAHEYFYIIRKLWRTTRSFFTIPVFMYFSQILAWSRLLREHSLHSFESFGMM